MKQQWFYVKWENSFGKHSRTVTRAKKDKLVAEFESKGWKYKVKPVIE